MHFHLSHQDGLARRGQIDFPRGAVQTPAFMPVGTYGTVKGMLPRDITEIGAEIILGNTFHLWLRTGTDIIKAHGLTARTKHFERWAAYVRDLYQRHIIAVSFKPTTAMPADIFTKALPEDLFKLFRDVLLG